MIDKGTQSGRADHRGTKDRIHQTGETGERVKQQIRSQWIKRPETLFTKARRQLVTPSNLSVYIKFMQKLKTESLRSVTTRSVHLPNLHTQQTCAVRGERDCWQSARQESVAGRAAGNVLNGSGRPSVWVDPGWFDSCVGSVFLRGEWQIRWRRGAAIDQALWLGPRCWKVINESICFGSKQNNWVWSSDKRRTSEVTSPLYRCEYSDWKKDSE